MKRPLWVLIGALSIGAIALTQERARGDDPPPLPGPRPKPSNKPLPGLRQDLRDDFDVAEDLMVEVERELESYRVGVTQGAAAKVLAAFADDFEGDTLFLAPESPETQVGPVTITPRGSAPTKRKDLETAVDRFLKQLDLVTHFAVTVRSARKDGEDVEATISQNLQARSSTGTLCIQDKYSMRLRRGRIARAVRLDGSRRLESRGSVFVDSTEPLGLSLPPNLECHFCNYNHISSHLTSGIALADFDGDGLMDIFVAGSMRSHLFRNRGDHFEDVTEKSGLADAYGNGAIWVDYDGDGRLDLLVTRYCHPDPVNKRCSPYRTGWCGGKGCAVQLYRNRGDGTFENVTERAGLCCTGPATSACAADYDRDGNVDIFVARYGYMAPTVGRPAEYNAPWAFPDPPFNGKNAPAKLLFHNNGDGTFTDVAPKAGVTDTGWTLACCFADLNEDGYPDLVLVNDMGRNVVYENRKDGTFTDVTDRSIPGDYGFGMGIARADFDNDGLLDLYVTKMFSNAGNRVIDDMEAKGRRSELTQMMRKFAEGATLLRNTGNGVFNDVSRGSNTMNCGWAFGTVFADYDNDGRPDLYVANGWVSAETQREM